MCMWGGRAAFRTVSQLQRVHADAPEALWYHEGLSPVVDACARSTSRLDEAFFLLEDMHLQVCRLPPSPRSGSWSLV